ncbi:MAG TPA: protein-tyrosine-phosphatase [Dongiaceae bacterium]|jgi:predicted protein tyrosine phosphatase|nr:protein-tyrosine-phosphatase [Dongiaceae bacterium]
MSARLLVRVGGLHTIDADLPSFRPTHLIGILDPTMPEPAAYRLHPPDHEPLVLRFRDTEVGADSGPTPEHVEAMLAFFDQRVFSAAAPGGRLFIHCHAGASRSTATAYLALVRQHGVGGAEAAFAELLRITVKPWPNRRLVEFADAHLGAAGRLLAPLDAYRAAHPQRLRAYLRLHLRRAECDPAYGEKLGMATWTVRPRA